MRKIFLLILLLPVAFIVSCSKKEAPVADFSYHISDLAVTFTAEATNDPERFEWDLGDGNTATGSVVSHNYAAHGSYTVTLTVTNEAGSTVVTKTVDVLEYMKVVKINTPHGEMYMWLYDETPLHKANFIKLTEEGFYNGTTFHRIIKNFMIQGGDPLSKDGNPDKVGSGGPGYTIPAEIRSDLRHTYGAVGAARLGDAVNPQKESSGSQFYIVVNKNGTPHLDNNYTVFGKIIHGMAAADTIVMQSTASNNRDRPDVDIPMQVSIVLKSHQQLADEFNFVP